MDHLPLSDIPMLVSTINFLLRDEIFDNLDQICYCFNVEREEMTAFWPVRDTPIRNNTTA